MKLNFQGDISDLKDGITILGQELGFSVGKTGVKIKVRQKANNLKISFKNGVGEIIYDKNIHFFRALGLFIEKLEEKDKFTINEEPKFDTNGVMIDCSRNSVMKVETIKKMLRLMAVMGLNMLMLYTEDTYEIEDNPYFGYFRGSYSQEELKECDDYANSLGIEMVPCIQTLAHLKEALKWDFADGIKDTDDILLVGEERTYRFIEKMIKAASAPFRSKRIHIGMDEAHFLGRGNYLDKHGHQRSFDIMNEHLKKVVEITKKYNLNPMIWSDMYFRLGSKTGDYYDFEVDIPEDVINNIPSETQLVYWDYYHNQKEEYQKLINKHKNLNKVPIFAGGNWTWSGLVPNFDKTMVSTNAALKACKSEGVKQVFATMWGDNGAETNVFSALPGLQLFAEHGYSTELDHNKLAKRFTFCTGADLEAYKTISKLDDIPGIKKQNIENQANPSKYLLWQDPLLGLFDKNTKKYQFADHYSNLTNKLAKHLENNKEWDFVFKMPKQLSHVLSLKSELGVQLKEKYDQNDQTALKEISQNLLPKLYQQIKKLRNIHRRQWLKTYKPFGWEVLDIRYGGLLGRIETVKDRLDNYVLGEIDCIEELEEDRLYFNGPKRKEDGNLVHCNSYNRIVSASPLG